jgi:hypothetical protein
LGSLAENNSFSLETTQRDAWLEEIQILKRVLRPYRDRGRVYFEYSIPRLGRRIDAVALIDQAVLVIEFKVGEREFPAYALDQVWDYALDLKNFHETSHQPPIAPILVATEAHIEFSTPEGWLLIDLSSTNGCFVNGRRVREHRLRDGDLIAVGHHQMRFTGPSARGKTLAPTPPEESDTTLVAARADVLQRSGSL